MRLLKLHAILPILGWKRIESITEQEADTLTGGCAEHMCNKDYWTLDGEYVRSSEIPVGERAVYKHDGSWFVVKRIALQS